MDSSRFSLDRTGTAVAPARVALHDPPGDWVSSLRFIPGTPNLLAATSWDKIFRIYDTDQNKCIYSCEDSHPLLCCAASNSRVYYGGESGGVISMDVEYGTPTQVIGKHGGAVSCMEFSSSRNMIVSGSWDASLMIWDERAQSSVGPLPQASRVVCLDVRDDLVVVAAGVNRIIIWDLRNPKSYVLQSFTGFHSQGYYTSSLRILPDKKAYVLGTEEGRVSVESVQRNDDSVEQWAFKAHVEKPGNVGYSVNSISILDFNPTGILTGGGDKKVRAWSVPDQKRVTTFDEYPASVTATDFTLPGYKMAVGCSFPHVMGGAVDPNHVQDTSIYIETRGSQVVL